MRIMYSPFSISRDGDEMKQMLRGVFWYRVDICCTICELTDMRQFFFCINSPVTEKRKVLLDTAIYKYTD